MSQGTAFEQAKKQLMQKYGMGAEQAGQMIEKGLRKLLAMVPPGTLPGVTTFADVEKLDEAGLIKLQQKAMAAIEQVKKQPKPGADGVERAKSKNKFV
jgi:hypothetical protein